MSSFRKDAVSPCDISSAPPNVARIRPLPLPGIRPLAILYIWPGRLFNSRRGFAYRTNQSLGVGRVICLSVSRDLRLLTILAFPRLSHFELLKSAAPVRRDFFLVRRLYRVLSIFPYRRRIRTIWPRRAIQISRSFKREKRHAAHRLVPSNLQISNLKNKAYLPRYCGFRRFYVNKPLTSIWKYRGPRALRN